ncbi:hypothetical protein L6164_014605 [Bauhinia variegata]|uniref:Uncharacterized protein n=1 Tax=Bauhinia variegata TaxID=167791 RepID=A0ACB9NHP6_BAUVA|nr:hypothetical protein L6164_014605 [Bauhinia variegata]
MLTFSTIRIGTLKSRTQKASKQARERERVDVRAMEFGAASGRSGGGHGGGVVKDEKRNESSGGGDDESRRQDEAVDHNKVADPVTITATSMVETTASIASTKNEKVGELESAMAEMSEVREENQRLKTCLDRILKDYRSLQMQFQDIVQAQQETKRSPDKENNDINDQELTEESELVSLSLGRVPRNPKSEDQTRVSKELKGEEFKEELSLGLDCKFETTKSGGTGSTTENLPIPSPTNCSEVPKEEAGETWPPSNVLKTLRDNNGDADEVSKQNPAKRARVCVRARCDTPTMNDGCQWRKYGQKIAKGNPCPRAYYRCTVAPSCPVRKQVQRWVEDMSILITTYEGTHNHPLPLSATAIASTTSAAASMLLSGSSTSRSTDLNGLNFYLSDNGSKAQQYYLSNPALSSPSPSHPTITLDLTSNPAVSQFGRLINPNYNPSRFSSSSTTSLNFSTSSQSNGLSWSNGFLSYGTQPQSYNNNNRNILSNINLGKSQQPIMEINNIFQSYLQKNITSTPSSQAQVQAQAQAQHSLPDHTIAAATKAITADPTFQSALAAALTSIIGNGSSGIGGTLSGNQGQVGVGENLSQNMKWGELFPPPTSTSKVNGCGSSFLSKTSTTAPSTSSLMFHPPSLPFASSKSASASPDNNRDNTN